MHGDIQMWFISIIQKIKPLDLAHSILTIILIIITFILSRQNQSLKEKISNIISHQTISKLEEGELVPPLTFETLEGITSKLSFPGSKDSYLLFFLKVDCPHCNNTLGKWVMLTDVLNHEKCSILGLSLSDRVETQKYVRDNNIPFTLGVISDSQIVDNYKISGVPMTLIVNPEGKVKTCILGELTDKNVDDIISEIRGQGSI